MNDEPEDGAYELFQRGLMLLDNGRARDALKPLEHARELEPDSSSIREALGRVYFNMRRYDDAAAEFRTIIDREPLEDYAHFCYAKCHDRLANNDLALRHYRLATAMRPARDTYRQAFKEFRARHGLLAQDDNDDDAEASDD